MDWPTVVLAEDHPHVAEELRLLLSRTCSVVAVVGHGDALISAARRLQPDVVVTDICMPGKDGIEAARELRGLQPSLGIVFVSVHDDPALVRRALAVGLGYVVKSAAADELNDAVEAAYHARRFVSAALGPLDV